MSDRLSDKTSGGWDLEKWIGINQQFSENSDVMKWRNARVELRIMTKGLAGTENQTMNILIETVLYKNQMDVRAEGVQIL